MPIPWSRPLPRCRFAPSKVNIRSQHSEKWCRGAHSSRHFPMPAKVPSPARGRGSLHGPQFRSPLLQGEEASTALNPGPLSRRERVRVRGRHVACGTDAERARRACTAGRRPAATFHSVVVRSGRPSGGRPSRPSRSPLPPGEGQGEGSSRLMWNRCGARTSCAHAGAARRPHIARAQRCCRRSSTVSSASRSIARRVPLGIVRPLWTGTVSRRLSARRLR